MPSLKGRPASSRVDTWLVAALELGRADVKRILREAGIDFTRKVSTLSAEEVGRVAGEAEAFGGGLGLKTASALNMGNGRTDEPGDPTADLGAEEAWHESVPYLGRVRAMLRRYLLVVRPWEGQAEAGGANGSALDREVARALSGGPAPAERARAAAALSAELAGGPATVVPAELAELPADAPVRRLCERFLELRYGAKLDDLECDLLWVLLAPELVPGLLGVYRGLWGDRDRVWSPREFVLAVLDPNGERRAELLARLDPNAPLIRYRLVEEQLDRFGETMRLRAAQRCVRHLLGDDTTAAEVAHLVTLRPPAPKLEAPENGSGPSLIDLGIAEPEAVLKRLRAGFRPGGARFLLNGPAGVGAQRVAQKILGDVGLACVEVRLKPILAEPAPLESFARALREARLLGSGLLLHDAQELGRDATNRVVRDRILAALAAETLPVILACDPSVSPELILEIVEGLEAVEVRLALPPVEDREALWARALQRIAPGQPAKNLAFIARAYALGIDEIEQGARLALFHARRANLKRPRIRAMDVESACRHLSSHRMRNMAVRVEVAITWDDVVLRDESWDGIQEMLAYGHHRGQVLDEWGYGRRMAYGRGITALFSGPSGTGKTLVSGLIARDLGLELYRVDLSQMVSKYVGETEQRLSSLFGEAKAGGVGLLFDEADSLFATRTQVSSSTDRYANLEVNFLLQELESFDGLVILTSNFPNAIDRAFMRRLKFKVSFPPPDEPERAKLWRRMIPTGAPQTDNLRLDLMAHAYDFTGGQIRNVTLRAAYLAASDESELTLDHLDQAAIAEMREAGRLVSTTARKMLDAEVMSGGGRKRR